MTPSSTLLVRRGRGRAVRRLGACWRSPSRSPRCGAPRDELCHPFTDARVGGVAVVMDAGAEHAGPRHRAGRPHPRDQRRALWRGDATGARLARRPACRTDTSSSSATARAWIARPVAGADACGSRQPTPAGAGAADARRADLPGDRRAASGGSSPTAPRPSRCCSSAARWRRSSRSRSQTDFITWGWPRLRVNAPLIGATTFHLFTTYPIEPDWVVRHRRIQWLPYVAGARAAGSSRSSSPARHRRSAPASR